MSLVKFLWIGYIIVILFFRFTFKGKIIILIYSICLALITLINALKSRNEWREIAQEYHKNLEENE